MSILPAEVTARGLELRDVQLRLPGRTLFAPLSAQVAPGEVLSVTGPSGSGKSSLLAWACGVLPAQFEVTGDLLLDGVSLLSLPTERRRLGILFQDALLFPHLSVGANVAFGLRAGVGGRAARRRMVDAALDSVGLGGYHDRDPATLSGGERVRVALLRVLLAEPRAVLLDEPFSRLDAPRRDSIRQLVFERCRERALPVLMVTHDAADVAAAGGRELALQPLPGQAGDAR
jgi:putative thiamine transport system ATP-binding protein